MLTFSATSLAFFSSSSLAFFSSLSFLSFSSFSSWALILSLFASSSNLAALSSGLSILTVTGSPNTGFLGVSTLTFFNSELGVAGV